MSATTTWHAGEVAMQRAAGVDERLAELGPRVLRDHMPEQHREFFEQLPLLFVGSLDAQQRPWASVLSGWPGFVATPDARHLRVDAWPRRGDPLCGGLALGADLGLLGIEPATRRRNRMNGTVVVLDEAGFEVRVDQSFGNCPQYIQARSPRWVERAPAEPVELGPRLDAAAGGLIARADTLFIASAAPGAGADVSHRGGRPGFVHVEIDQDRAVLTFPDFRGNFFFNTLGNLVAHPKAGLLFVDYATGDVLQVTGRATIVASGPEVEAFAGAQRMVRIEVDAGVWWAQVLPFTWSEPEQASQLAATGRW